MSHTPTPAPWQIRNVVFDWGSRTYIMGILNTTPDSFSDGGEFNTVTAAIAQARKMIAAGADIIDIGGQSTRPGAETISLAEELERTIPVIQALRQECDVPISIDTTRSQVAQAALQAGADVINDISGGTFDPQILALAAQTQAPMILMHLRGTPQTMQQLTDYQDLIGEMRDFFTQQTKLAQQQGVLPRQMMLDPGVGFAKTAAQNLTLLRQLSAFKSLGFPLLVGPSRKSFIGKILDQPDPKQRVWGTGAACVAAIAGGADMVRVHDVEEMGQVCRVADAIWRGDHKS
ncbi:MAG: dihydropteroate synthase [Synechocystis sp.]